jgi:phospholipase C
VTVLGWVASETFDHTSIIRFAETLFGVHHPTISPGSARGAGAC